jgi:hypothetical protein
VFDSRKRNRTRAKTSASLIRDSLCRQRRDDASIERCLWVARVGSPPMVVAHAYSFLTHPPLLKVIILLHVSLSAATYPHMTAWSGVQCHHHSRLCSNEAVASHTRCWTPARPAVASVIIPARRSLLALLFAFRSTFPGYPGPGTAL